MTILTIAIPTYNSSKYLKETLEKTIIQCGKNNEIEILVSDNCSTDDTEAVVKDFINKGINILDKELIDYKQYKLNQYDELAKLFEENINLNRIFNM